MHARNAWLACRQEVTWALLILSTVFAENMRTPELLILLVLLRAPVAQWIRELTLNPLGFSPLWFESHSGHMWESQVLLTDGQVVFPRVLQFSPTFDERSTRYKWNILERAVNPPPPPPTTTPPHKKKKKKKKKKILVLLMRLIGIDILPRKETLVHFVCLLTDRDLF